MPRADWDFLGQLEIVTPPSELLVKFQGIFNDIFEQINNLTLSNDNLFKTKNSLLPRLISGKLSVEELDIQFPPSMVDEDAA